LEKSPSKVRDSKNIENNPMQSSRRPAERLESKLTRRANQGHFFTIPQSCNARPSLRNCRRADWIAAQNPHPTIEIAPAHRGERSPARGRTARLPQACQGIST
jgi:hypothetical protein